jgi:L-threonylcarbamoyladenylate synthase
MAEIGVDVKKAAVLLSEGKCVAVPTETVYGLAANALHEDAVLQIFRIKERPNFDPLIVHCKNSADAFSYASIVPVMARKLADEFWPGPLTIVLPKNGIIPMRVTSGLDTVGLRVSNHPKLLELLNLLPFPLAAPSANPFGYVSPTSATHVNDSLGEKIDYILDGGECEKGIESTIIGFENEEPVVYRLGSLSLESLEKVTGKLKLKINSSSNPVSPGQVKMHYSPHKKVFLSDYQTMKGKLKENCGFITFKLPIVEDQSKINIVLSKSGSFSEAARNLFAALRALDSADCEVIYAEVLPEDELGRAINDRLRRAAAK